MADNAHVVYTIGLRLRFSTENTTVSENHLLLSYISVLLLLSFYTFLAVMNLPAATPLKASRGWIWSSLVLILARAARAEARLAENSSSRFDLRLLPKRHRHLGLGFRNRRPRGDRKLKGNCRPRRKHKLHYYLKSFQTGRLYIELPQPLRLAYRGCVVRY